MADISKIKIEDGIYDIKDETARNQIEELQIPKNYFADKKFIMIGDSYAVAETPQGNIDSWEQLFIDYTGIDSSNVIKKAQGGAGFVNLGSNKKFQTLLEEVPSSDEITDIVVLGGYNDRSYNATQIGTAINEFKLKAVEKFPNAKIHVGFIGWCKISVNFKILTDSIQAYKNACALQGIHYIDGIEYSLREYFVVFSSDNVHPNHIGQVYITFNLIQGLMGGSCQYQMPFINLTITPKSGYSLTDGNHIVTMLKGNCVAVANQSDNMTFAISPGLTLTGRSNWVELGDITGGYIFGSNVDFTMVPVRVMTHSDEGYITSIGLAKFANGKFYINLGMTINPSTGAYQSYTNLVEIKVDRFHGMFLADFN